MWSLQDTTSSMKSEDDKDTYLLCHLSRWSDLPGSSTVWQILLRRVCRKCYLPAQHPVSWTLHEPVVHRPSRIDNGEYAMLKWDPDISWGEAQHFAPGCTTTVSLSRGV